MAADVTVRPAVAGDVDDIRAVAERGWTAAYGDVLPESVIDAAMAEWYDPEEVAARVADGAFFVADDDGIVGYVSGAAAEDDPEGAVLEAIYVDPDRWGEGVGSRLLRRFEAWCRDRGRPSVRFRVLAGNDVAPPFYRSHGYRAVGETETELFGTAVTERRFRGTVDRRPNGAGEPAAGGSDGCLD